MHLLALDVGQCCVRAAVVEHASLQWAGPIVRTDFAVSRPAPEAAEVSPRLLWDALVSSARRAALGVEGIVGIGLCVFEAGLVLLDEKDQPAAPIWMPEDRRARPAARQTDAELGEKFLAEIGSRPLPAGLSAIRFRQMLVQDPYLIREVRRYLHLNSWLALRLTGETAFDPANASHSGLYGTLTTQAWAPRWCDYFEVDPAWLPPVVPATTVVGALRSAVAAELGVPGGVPVRIGTTALCTKAGALGMRQGDLLHEVGDTQRLAAAISRPSADSRRTIVENGLGNDFLHVTYNPVGISAIEWLRKLCFRDQCEQEFLEKTLADAMDRSNRIILDPPYLAGDLLAIEARRAAFRDLTLQSDRLDLLAALIQEMRRQHERALAGLGLDQPVQRIFLSGQGTSVIQKLLPDYAKAEIHLCEPDPLIGIARLF